MFFRQKLRTLFLMLEDLLIFYASLFLAVFIRYFTFQKEVFSQAFLIFSPVFILWLFVFYIGKIYDLTLLKNRLSYYNRLFFIFLINILIAVLFFYVFYPFYRPKIVLLFLALFSYIFVNLGHLLFYHLIKTKTLKIFVVSEKSIAQDLAQYLKQNPQLGYEVEKIFDPQDFLKNLKEEKIPKGSFLIINSSITLDESLLLNFQVMELIDFYEMIFQKIPLELLSGGWIAKNILNKSLDLYEVFKRIFDFLVSLIILLVSFPIWPLIALLIKIDSEGSVFYISKRIGLKGKPFFIYKFRTMVKNAHEIGPSWTLEKDSRITKIGRFLRRFHLDEIPQLINVLKGEMSLIGPRPEEENLVDLYKKEIPFYRIRFLIKPGILGWAQINYPHTSSVEEAKEKFSYDLFYLKNRSFVLDLLIFFRVFISIFEIKTH
ncbi:MAG: sugar transferase [Candidatus Paceibacterota bacterium]